MLYVRKGKIKRDAMTHDVLIFSIATSTSQSRQIITLRNILGNMTLFTLIIIFLSANMASTFNLPTLNDKFCTEITERRDGDPVLFKGFKHGILSEKSYNARCILYRFAETLEDRELFLDGLYIGAHKYFGKDPRKESVKPELFKKFPSKEVNIYTTYQLKLKEACEASAKECVAAVFEIAGKKSGTVQQFLVSCVSILYLYLSSPLGCLCLQAKLLIY